EEGGILAERAAHDLFERLAFPLAALEQLVGRVDVGEMVLVVMVLQRLTRHVGRQRVVGIGKFGERKRHRCLLTHTWGVVKPQLGRPRGGSGGVQPSMLSPIITSSPGTRGGGVEWGTACAIVHAGNWLGGLHHGGLFSIAA